MAFEKVVYVAEDQLPFPSGIRGHDYFVALAEQLTQYFQLFKRSGIRFRSLRCFNGSHDQFKGCRNNRQHLPIDMGKPIVDRKGK